MAQVLTLMEFVNIVNRLTLDSRYQINIDSCNFHPGEDDKYIITEGIVEPPHIDDVITCQFHSDYNIAQAFVYFTDEQYDHLLDMV